jgi:hypothetical protein
MSKVILKEMAGPDNPIYTGELFIGARLISRAEVKTADPNPEMKNDKSNSETGSEDSKFEKGQK